jgi:hypothetical protein
MTQTYLVLAVVVAGGVAYLVRDYKRTFLVSAGLTWLFGMMLAFLGRAGCYYSVNLALRSPSDQAVHAVPLAVAVAAAALLFAYALKQHEARQ